MHFNYQSVEANNSRAVTKHFYYEEHRCYVLIHSKALFPRHLTTMKTDLTGAGLFLPTFFPLKIILLKSVVTQEDYDKIKLFNWDTA